jgi:hypothetical protein
MFLSRNWLRWSAVAGILVLGISSRAMASWYCDAKDGKFTFTPCANCKKMYCWGGHIYSEEPGYASPPGFVLAYWEQKHRESEQIRAEIDRKGKELKAKFQDAQKETERLNAERGQQSKQFNDDLERNSAAIRAAVRNRTNAPPASRTGGTMATNAVNRRTQPKLEAPVSTSVVSTPQGPVEPAPVPVSRAKLNEIQTGMEKAAVIERLGAPRAMMSIPDDGVLVETLTYRVEGNTSAKVRLENGKVASVKLAE